MTAGPSPEDRIADVVRLSRPALQALARAGIDTVAELTRWSRGEVAALHGIGPTAFSGLEAALAARGLTFKPS